MINKILLITITIIHLLIVCFVVGTPFFGNNYTLLIHAIIVPFIIAHWITNDDTCVLTTMELYLRESIYGKPTTKDDCLTCKIISPVYNLTTQYKEYIFSIYAITIVLWLTSVSKLCYKYYTGSIVTPRDLFTPTYPLFSLR